MGGAQAPPAGEMDRRAQRIVSFRTRRAATTRRTPSWRSTRKEISSRCKVDTLADLGAYVSTFGAAIPGPIYSALLAGVYRTPAVFVEVNGVFSNTVPTDAYRGAGRPEACYVLERLADKAARELEARPRRDPAAQSGPRIAMPYETPVGPTYDCGNFPQDSWNAHSQYRDYAGFERAESGRSQRS